MKMRIFNAFVLFTAVTFAPTIGHSADIAIDFGRGHSVTVTKASVIDQSDHALQLAGQLYRPHRLPLAGHLHAYAYLTNGDLVADSKHQVLGLNSQRGGSMRLPFRISMKDVAENIDRVYLEYHSPGHSEL